MSIKERKNSERIYLDSCNVIPGGVNSPVRSFPGLSMTPLVVKKGKGDTLWDADGHSYIDYCCSWGALILGHAHPLIVKAVCEEMQNGSSFGITTMIEEELASRVVKHVPSLEKIRFVSSGTEAVMSAARLARGFTKRNIIVKFNGNYHGHADSFLIKAGSGVTNLNAEASSLGVPKEMVQHTVSLPYNDIETTRSFLRSSKDIAAVLLEPIAGNMGVVPGNKDFIAMLREETEKNGSLLIFDEVISGFRVGLQGAQGLYGITPDLSCFGKIVGGGMPAAAFGGSKEIMDLLAPLGGVYQAGTLSGNPIAMRAGLETLKEIEKPHFYEDLEEKTQFLTAPIEAAFVKKNMDACIQRVGSMFTIFFGAKKINTSADLAKIDQELFKRFFIYLFERGIYIPPSPYEACFISSSHTEENLKETQEMILEFISQV